MGERSGTAVGTRADVECYLKREPMDLGAVPIEAP
jgi:hypothetical protein